jgi:hypothetical protein
MQQKILIALVGGILIVLVFVVGDNLYTKHREKLAAKAQEVAAEAEEVRELQRTRAAYERSTQQYQEGIDLIDAEEKADAETAKRNDEASEALRKQYARP